MHLQVGIVALNLIGEQLQPAAEGPPLYLDVEGPTSHDLPYYNRAAADVADLQLDIHVDSVTAARIKVGCWLWVALLVGWTVAVAAAAPPVSQTRTCCHLKEVMCAAYQRGLQECRTDRNCTYSTQQ